MGESTCANQSYYITIEEVGSIDWRNNMGLRDLVNIRKHAEQNAQKESEKMLAEIQKIADKVTADLTDIDRRLNRLEIKTLGATDEELSKVEDTDVIRDA